MTHSASLLSVIKNDDTYSTKRTRLLVVGNGRVARTLLQCSFDHTLVQIERWHRSVSISFVEMLEQMRPTHIVLAITDAAIQPFVQEHWVALADLAPCTLVHCAGQFGRIHVSPPPMSFGVEADHVITIEPAHPLMTFPILRSSDGGNAVHPVAYDTLPFVLSADGHTLHDLLPTLPNPFYVIPDSLRSYYHALCSIMVSGTVILHEKLDMLFSTVLHLPSEALLPFREQMFENIKTREPHTTVLSGPIARGDSDTLATHDRVLRAMQNVSLADIYLHLQTLAQLDASSVHISSLTKDRSS